MTIDRYKGENFVVCDGCSSEMVDKRGNTARFDPKDFDVLLDAMKEAGWKASKGVDGKWEHYCPDCQ